jgi:hypothetical protein
MHSSIWTFRGDPDELLRRYEAVLADVPAANMRLHLCLREPDGIVVVDTCPDRDAFDGFVAGFRELRALHGMPDPERLDDFPVAMAFVDGERRVGSR